MVPARDFSVLLSVALYDEMTRAQVQRLHFPDDKDGRITRKRLTVLHEEVGLLNRTNMRTVNPAVNAGVGAPCYYLSAKGAEFLAQETEDPAYKLCNTTTPHHLYLYHYLYHFIAVTETQMMLRRACELAGDVEVAEWLGERSLKDPREKDPAKRYRLYHRFHEKLCCVPDAGFLLRKGEFRKVYYLEQDRDTTKSAERVASQKAGGFAALAEQQIHLTKHFPAATWKNFNVLCVTPTPRRRDALRKAVSKQPLGMMWKFASLTDLKPETFLTGPVWFKGDGKEGESLLQKGPK